RIRGRSALILARVSRPPGFHFSSLIFLRIPRMISDWFAISFFSASYTFFMTLSFDSFGSDRSRNEGRGRRASLAADSEDGVDTHDPHTIHRSGWRQPRPSSW